MKKVVSVSLLAALAIAAVVGALSYRAASAQTATSEDGQTTQSPVAGMHFKGKGPGGFQGGITTEDLAAALGITTDELATAYQKANEAMLAKAVETGLITQAQADDLQANGHAFPFGGRWQGWLDQNGLDYQTFLADALGVSIDQLQAAYTQAFNARIDQAVADGQLSQEQADLMKGQRALQSDGAFQSAMRTAYEAAIQQAVEDGVITQAQADLILAKAASGPGQGGFPGIADPYGFGGFEGRPGHGRRGGWGGEPVNPEEPTTTP